MKKVLFLSLIAGILFTSCVSSKKYMASQARVNQLQIDSSKCQSNLNDCFANVKSLTDQKATLQNENDMVKGDMKDLTSESKLTIAEQAQRLKKLMDMIQAQRDGITKLKNSMADALMNYKTDELNITIIDGKVYVSLEEKLLFKSGSDVVDPKGKEALKTLAKVLNTTKNINVDVEGYTDNVPIKTKQFSDNWDLSTARATSILRILTNDNGFDPNRITASGRGEYHPVKTNNTEAGRASNRRTEIILSPDMKELYKLLDQ